MVLLFPVVGMLVRVDRAAKYRLFVYKGARPYTCLVSVNLRRVVC